MSSSKFPSAPEPDAPPITFISTGSAFTQVATQDLSRHELTEDDLASRFRDTNWWETFLGKPNDIQYRFRRFDTMQLLNIRLLEAEIHKVDRAICRAAPALEAQSKESPLQPSGAQLDAEKPRLEHMEDIMNVAEVGHLRKLLKEYSEFRI